MKATPSPPPSTLSDPAIEANPNYQIRKLLLSNKDSGSISKKKLSRAALLGKNH